MEDFKIGDDFDENGNVKEHKFDKKIIISIVIVISIIFGLLVFFVSNLLLGGNKEPETPVDTQVKLSDENVKILYSYVKYDDSGYGNDKFLKEKSVNINSFDDQDKLYYTLKFIEPEELTYSEKKDDKGQKIYDLPLSRIKNKTQRFFGKDINISPVEKLTYKFNFTINELNIADLNFSEEEQVYKTVLKKEEEKEPVLVKPYYTELTSATKKQDGTLILNEKVIYTTVEKENENYKIGIYKDYDHTTLLELRQNITEEDLKNNPVTIEKYKDKAATVSYVFKVNNINRNYYFDNSSITY